MPAKKTNRRIKPTTEEIELANDLQAPTAAKRGRKLGTTLNAVMDFNTIRKDARALRGDGEETNWLPSEELVGVAFYIVKAFTFESENDGETKSKVGFEIKFAPEDGESAGCFSLPWNEDRAAIVTTIKAQQKRTKGLCIGPVMLGLVEPTDPKHKPYRKLVSYSEEAANEARAILAAKVMTPKRGRKAKTE